MSNNNDEKVVLQFDDLIEALGGDVTLVPTETSIKEPKEETTEDVIETEVQMTETECGNIITIDEKELQEMNDESTDKFSDLEDFYKELGMEGNETIDMDSVVLSDKVVAKACKDLFNLDQASINKITKLIKEYRPLSEEEKNKYNVYRKLPDKLKMMIDSGSPGKEGRNMVAREFLEEIIQASCIDTEFNKVKDLMGSIAKEMDIKNTTKMYTEYQQGLFETNLSQHRDNIKDTNPEKADLLDKIIKSFKNAYTFDNLIEAYKTNGGKYKPKKIELEKFESRILDNFNMKYVNSEFDIPNIHQAYHMLDKKLPADIDLDDIKRFFVLFCKYTKDFSPSNVEEHTFMYYTIMNIITLNFTDIYNEDDKNEFLDKVKQGVINTINTIKECDEAHR